MRFLNEQAQLFAAAALVFAVGLFLLYLALGLWAMVIERILRLIGVQGAIMEFVKAKRYARGAKPWFIRIGDWAERFLYHRE